MRKAAGVYGVLPAYGAGHPTGFAGLICCVLLEKTKILGYGAEIPEDVLAILKKSSEESEKTALNRTMQH